MSCHIEPRNSASQILEQTFGPLATKIVSAHESKGIHHRESVRTTQDGRVLAYNLVDFDLPTPFKREHELILQGNPLATTFQCYGHPIFRDTLCFFSFQPLKSLIDLFQSEDNPLVKVVDFYVGREPAKVHYAKIIEIYSPVTAMLLNYTHDSETQEGLIAATIDLLKKHTFKR